MQLKVYNLLAIAHYFGVQQGTLQKASGLGANTLSVWKNKDRHPTPERFYKAQSALIELAGLPVEYKNLEIEDVARIVIK
jgi:hypothetical protein